MSFDAHFSKRTTADLAWFAGLFEGEGTVTPHRGKCRAQALAIAMTDEDVLRHAHGIVRVGHIYGPYLRERCKPIWQWKVGRSEDTVGLAMTIYPMLGNRRQKQIVRMLESWKNADLPSRLKSHCIHGHALIEENLCAWDRSRARRCRLCHNERTKSSKRAKRVLS